MKKADPNPKANRHILMITYAVAALFAGLVDVYKRQVYSRGDLLSGDEESQRCRKGGEGLFEGVASPQGEE